MAACVDDTNEEDDSRSAASANATARGSLEPGTYDFVACPKAVQPTSGSKMDDDWHQIVVTADTKLDMWLYGSGESDLDLTLYRSNETVLSKSTSLEADENIVKCLTPGTYYVKINGWDNIRSEYLLDYIATPQTCNTTCVDDTREDDDTYSQARSAYDGYMSTGNTICPNDDDWYKVRLKDGEKLTIDMTSTLPGDLDIHLFKGEFTDLFPCSASDPSGCTPAHGQGATANEHAEFTQSSPDQDLDLHLYQGFTDLWPCSAADPSTCTIAHGQGAVSNEHAVYTVPTGCEAGCDYYVVVRGYNGSTNSYGISLKVQ